MRDSSTEEDDSVEDEDTFVPAALISQADIKSMSQLLHKLHAALNKELKILHHSLRQVTRTVVVGKTIMEGTSTSLMRHLMKIMMMTCTVP